MFTRPSNGGRANALPMIRLDKYLSDLGLFGRRESREVIRAGRVSVDGLVMRSPEYKLEAQAARVSLDGEALDYRRLRYFMLDKPEGVVTATEDRAEKTVLDLLPESMKKLGLFPVGRLDKDTTGLLLLTNDGDFAHRVISPKSAVEKRYYALVDGIPDERDAAAFREGLTLADGTRCLPALLETDGTDACFVTVTEGKYHQVKRMLAARGKPVRSLRRLSIGALSLPAGSVPGMLRELTAEDLCRVFIDR